MTISIVLVDDWELRGDGSGNMDKIQFATLSRLLAIYESFGLRASINAEIMQQIYHLRYGEKHQHLAKLAARWEETVTDAYRRGHDVQLHVHSQWHGAYFENGKWVLPGNWSILTYSRNDMVRMIHDCRIYLEGLFCALYIQITGAFLSGQALGQLHQVPTYWPSWPRKELFST